MAWSTLWFSAATQRVSTVSALRSSVSSYLLPVPHIMNNLRFRVILYFPLRVPRDIPTSPKLSEALETFPADICRVTTLVGATRRSPDVIRFLQNEPGACVTNVRICNANRAFSPPKSIIIHRDMMIQCERWTENTIVEKRASLSWACIGWMYRVTAGNSRADIIFRFIHQQSTSFTTTKSIVNIDKIVTTLKRWRSNIHPNAYPFFLCTLVDCHDLGLWQSSSTLPCNSLIQLPL